MTSLQPVRLNQLDARIRTVWLRAQALHLLKGLLAFVRWAIPMFLAGMLVDWMTYMPAMGRGVIFIVLLAVALSRAWVCGWRDLRRFNARSTALRIEECQGDLDSLLVSALQFRDAADDATGSPVLRERACRKAEDAASGVSPSQTVPYRSLQRPATIAAVLAGVIVLFAVINGPFLAAGLTRIFSPWLDIKYPTKTQIGLGQDNMVIKEGDSAEIRAQLSGVIPDKAVIFVRTGEGRAREIELEVAQTSCSYTIASASRDFTYRIKAGDDRTDWHQVRVIPAPRVSRAKVDLAYPDYIARASESTQALTLTVPEGTGVRWELTLDRAVSAAQFISDEQQPIDLQVSDDGRVVTFEKSVSASRGYNFAWIEKEHGFHFTSPRYHVQVASDQEPRVEITSPERDLVAMIGRPLNITVRAEDDHGIGSAQIAYRVNNRDDVTVELPPSASAGQEDRPVDWDYREAIADLEIGDILSITLVARDRYPGPQGPHVARSDTRHVTFLSKEDYLKHIQEQRDRLLSRVQALYRQQRDAHTNVNEFDPEDSEYSQSTQMEAIRQELVREQLKDVAGKLQALLDDLAANNVSDAPQGDSLALIRQALLEIADGHTAKAASLLRDQSAIKQLGTERADPSDAAHAINDAARALSSLVLLRSIESAQEVFARETRMLAEVEASLRYRTMATPEGVSAQSLAARQQEVAQWTQDLVSGLLAGIRYDKRPLATLRLVRRAKDLSREQVAERAATIASLIQEGKADQASSMQAELMRTYLNYEFSIRLTSAYMTLVRTKNQLESIAKAQDELRSRCAQMSAEDFQQGRPEVTKAQFALRKRLLTLLLPTVPAPRAELFDQSHPVAPPADAMLLQIDHAMSDALEKIQASDKDATTAVQTQAQQTLAQLIPIVETWAAELGLQTQGLGTLVVETSERLAVLQSFEARSLLLLDRTDRTVAEDQPVTSLADSQALLAAEVDAYAKALAKQNQDHPDRHIPPLLSRLAHVERAMAKAVDALKRNEVDLALEHQESAANAVTQTRELLEAQNQQLATLQALLLFKRAVGFSTGFMTDIVAQQRDLLAATRAAEPGAMSPLLPQFQHMVNCLLDVSPLLDLVASRMDVGTPLAFAQADFQDVVSAVDSGDKLDAVDAQDVAVESLAKVRGLLAEIDVQTDYIAEAITYVHDTLTDTTVLEHKQEDLLYKIQNTPSEGLELLVKEQEALITQVEQLNSRIELATGMPQFAEVITLMREVQSQLRANDATAAGETVQLMLKAYVRNKDLLTRMVSALCALPSATVNAKSKPELVRLIDVLAVASHHKRLLRDTHDANADTMQTLGQRQRELAQRSKKVAGEYERHAVLEESNKHLAEAAAAFASGDRAVLRRSQKLANEKLLHFIIEQAVLVYAPPGEPPDIPPAESLIESQAEIDLVGFISDFAEGEAPKDSKSDWQTLGERVRASLNQNFARELPLEYRSLLKDYYERVAK